MITADDVRATYTLIAPHVRRTPVIELDAEDLLGTAGRVTLKLEHLQRAGSFKARGAFAHLLLREVPKAGVVAASGGNHGVAVAYAAAALGLPARVFVPEISAAEKVARIRRLGADLVVGGAGYAEALAAAQAWQAESGALAIHAFDQRETLLGAGSVALELVEQAQVDTVLVPVGGGGLIGGMAAFLAGSVKLVGVEPTGAPTLTVARAAGQPADAPVGSIAADALAPRRVGELAFPLTQAHVGEVVLVDDDAITAARARLWGSARILAEPAAVVGVAALLVGSYVPAEGERVAAVISGANTSDIPA